MEKETVPAIWKSIETGQWRTPTAGLAPGYAQANVVMLPKEHAFDFLLYCYRNEQPCPVIDVAEPGETGFSLAGPGADIRYHVPRYRIYRNGRLEKEADQVADVFTDDMVTFLIGCSFTFEEALIREGIPVRHIQLGRNVPMYVTNVQTRKAGVFSGPMVVSMRPMTPENAKRAEVMTRPFRKAHGGPVHMGAPEKIGIQDLSKVDFGDPPVMREGEIPVFWACGVTPQMAILQAKLPLAVTHAPGHMFITTMSEEELRNRQ